MDAKTFELVFTDPDAVRRAMDEDDDSSSNLRLSEEKEGPRDELPH